MPDPFTLLIAAAAATALLAALSALRAVLRAPAVEPEELTRYGPERARLPRPDLDAFDRAFVTTAAELDGLASIAGVLVPFPPAPRQWWTTGVMEGSRVTLDGRVVAITSEFGRWDATPDLPWTP